jgi:hypothetical protein
LSTACSATSRLNWRGRPLISHEVVVDLIAATTTRTGLRRVVLGVRRLVGVGVLGEQSDAAGLGCRGHMPAWCSSEAAMMSMGAVGSFSVRRCGEAMPVIRSMNDASSDTWEGYASYRSGQDVPRPQ